jgi:phage protein U
MILRLVSTLILLTACASPAPEFFGAEQTRVELSGVRFAVFHRGNRAEAIRLDRIPADRHREMPVLLVQAMEQATGCTVIRQSMAGDTTEIRASLRC